MFAKPLSAFSSCRTLGKSGAGTKEAAVSYLCIQFANQHGNGALSRMLPNLLWRLAGHVSNSC